MMKTTFNPAAGKWQQKTTDILPKHDLYFGSPINECTAGIPLGDGDTGSLIWLEKDGIHIHLNKCDLWDDSSQKDSIFCSREDEDLTCLRHGGEITIHFDSPCFDYVYQEAFEQRLSLADATMRLSNRTPFSKITAEAFASADAHTTILHCSVRTQEADAPVIRLSRWGSRNLWRWYGQQRKKFSSGLIGTESCVEDRALYITQKLNGTNFCVGILIDTDSGFCTERKNSHEGAFLLDKALQHDFTLYYNISLGENVEEAQKNCAQTLTAAWKQGREALYEAHKNAWNDFWNRSYINYNDDYLENMYYLYLYIMNSGGRGKYPFHFTSGLWGFNHDYIPWTYYFHYNMQHMYAPLGTAGHTELAENYHGMRSAQLEMAKIYAREVKGKNGAFYHDVTDRYGRGADYDSLNCTPTSQIAMAMWHHYRYTGDEVFLKEKAFPMMFAAADFYLDMLTKEEDGLYHIHGTTAYEGNEPTDDTMTDYVMIYTLFGVLISYAGGEYQEQLKDVLEHLPAPILVDLDESDLEGEVFSACMGKGKKPVGDHKVFAYGYENGQPMRKMWADTSKLTYGFPDIELSPLYPAGCFGLKDRGTRLYDVMTNQIALHTWPNQGCMHWNMAPMYLARMGMAEEAKAFMRGMVDVYQGFPNGFNAEQGDAGCNPPFDRKKWMDFKDIDHPEKRAKARVSDFVHFDFETPPILACGILESLIQSHEGLIRLCPAIEEKEAVSFRLYAEGGFMVGVNIDPDSYCITVDNLRGEGFYLRLPEYADETALHVYRKNGAGYAEGSVVRSMLGKEEVLDFTDSVKGEQILLCSAALDEIEAVDSVVSMPNIRMKECGNACLGSPALL